jgi:hypothetical protein
MDYSNVVPGLFRDTKMRLIRDLTGAHPVGLAPAAVDPTVPSAADTTDSRLRPIVGIQGLNFMVAG